MSIAAVPTYLGEDFSSASPGMRFGMYLPLWTSRDDQEREVNRWAAGRSPQAMEIRKIREQQGMDAAIAYAKSRRNFPELWKKNDFSAKEIWRGVTKLGIDDREVIEGINRRQQQFSTLCDEAAVFYLPAQSISPFVTGMGNEHPLENGFSFLWPYGVPYLPGSSIKGVLRQAVRELASGEWGEHRGWSNEKVFHVQSGGKGLDCSIIDILFGLESKDHQQEHLQGVLTFWDIVPEMAGNQLMVEIMTPHQSHYYQKDKTVAPHDSGDPTPIQFLTVPAGSKFNFNIICNTIRLQRIAPKLLEKHDGDDKPLWKMLVQEALQHAFDWCGFGAKTAIGYGAMQRDPDVLKREQEEQQERELLRQEEEKKKMAEERAAAEKAAFEALSEAEQAKKILDDALLQYPDKVLKEQYGSLFGEIKCYLEKARFWSEDERNEAADYCTGLLEKYGWAPSGLKADKRKKQKAKKEKLIQDVRDGKQA